MEERERERERESEGVGEREGDRERERAIVVANQWRKSAGVAGIGSRDAQRIGTNATASIWAPSISHRHVGPQHSAPSEPNIIATLCQSSGIIA